jgi:hypothetical protein
MAKDSEKRRAVSSVVSDSPTAQNKAAGSPDAPQWVADALSQELQADAANASSRFAPPTKRSRPRRTRPVSPNIQIYRPQLTSVLSIANRITGLIVSLAAVALVV